MRLRPLATLGGSYTWAPRTAPGKPAQLNGDWLPALDTHPGWLGRERAGRRPSQSLPGGSSSQSHVAV